LAPVLDEIARDRAGGASEESANRRSRSGLEYPGLAARASRVAKMIQVAADSVGIPLDPQVVTRRLLVAARALVRSEALLDRRATRLVLVASQHDTSVRAALSAARRRGIPSVYVPHAPFADVPWYADLPVDYAALRGAAEVERYTGLGGDLSRMIVTGNPMVDAIGHGARVVPHGRVVLALSPWNAADLGVIMELVAAAIGEGVVVAPHPRSDRRLLQSLLPQGWVVWDADTFSLLRSGVTCVIQRSSGVAWESLVLGIPTIQLAWPGETVPYPIIDPSRVPFVSSSRELAEAVTAARGATESDRLELRAWAREWCAVQGVDAAEAIASVVRTAESRGAATGWVLDGWSPDREH
jgi:hypothetical protein